MDKLESTDAVETSTCSAYDAYFRRAVQTAKVDPTPGVPHEEAELYFSKKRAELLTAWLTKRSE
ncbi:hypothetical protein [Chromobacterium sp. ASV23]|uniref:hypothetical protein n=1 Tax=Chromobacterium sp. ASV23 TaxID=2795110 RepID=UPI0018EDB926|nr:hypothetical protein [Chromobacterium sp. ASV23]